MDSIHQAVLRAADHDFDPDLCADESHRLGRCICPRATVQVDRRRPDTRLSGALDSHRESSNLHRLALSMVDSLLQRHAWAAVHYSQGVSEEDTGLGVGHAIQPVHLFEEKLGTRPAEHGQRLTTTQQTYGSHVALTVSRGDQSGCQYSFKERCVGQEE